MGMSSLEEGFLREWRARRGWMPVPDQQYPFVARACGVPEWMSAKCKQALEIIEAKENDLHITLPNFVSDFAWPKYKVAVEMDGLAPGHMAFSGWIRDQRKGNLYSLFGWTLFRFCAVDLSGKNTDNMLTLVTVGLAAAGCPIEKPAESLVAAINELLQS